MQAALMDVRIPHVEMTEGSAMDEQPELELDDDPAVAATLDTSNVPLLITVAQVCTAAFATLRVCVSLQTILNPVRALDARADWALQVLLLQAEGACAVDLTAEEEGAVGQGSLQIGVNARGQVCHVRKRGPGALHLATLQVSVMQLKVFCCALSCVGTRAEGLLHAWLAVHSPSAGGETEPVRAGHDSHGRALGTRDRHKRVSLLQGKLAGSHGSGCRIASLCQRLCNIVTDSARLVQSTLRAATAVNSPSQVYKAISMAICHVWGCLRDLGGGQQGGS